MVRDRGDDAAAVGGETVSMEVDGAGWWGGVGVYVVPGGGVCEAGDVADSVGVEGGGGGVLGVEEDGEEGVDWVVGGGEVQEGDGCGGAVA